MNIAAIIGEYIYLKSSSEDFVGRCPFCLYHEHHFVVIPRLNTYECLHCGQHGGALDFIKHINVILKWEFKRSQRRAVHHAIGTVYVLKLEGDHYYIGFTQNFEHRLTTHFNGKGAAWTRRFAPIALADVYFDVPEFVEHRITKLYIKRYGLDKVRGGRHLDAQNETPNYDSYPRFFNPKRLNRWRGPV